LNSPNNKTECHGNNVKRQAIVIVDVAKGPDMAKVV
jgi:hypothetical protein